MCTPVTLPPSGYLSDISLNPSAGLPAVPASMTTDLLS